jgi:glutathione S-transferase
MSREHRTGSVGVLTVTSFCPSPHADATTAIQTESTTPLRAWCVENKGSGIGRRRVHALRQPHTALHASYSRQKERMSANRNAIDCSASVPLFRWESQRTHLVAPLFCAAPTRFAPCESQPHSLARVLVEIAASCRRDRGTFVPRRLIRQVDYPSNMLTLLHHPYSRAAGTVWALEELGEPYELQYVDIAKGDQKAAAVRALNPMGKLPILTDGDTVVTESAAINLYLADRYAYGRLAPRVDDPKRATYLRWSLFAPSVVEPGCYAKFAKWEFKPGSAGWGDYDTMLDALDVAFGGGDFILGDTFSMADVILGGTLRYMLRFKMIDPRPSFTAYAERLGQRPALQRADARNAAVMAEHGLGK